MLCHHFKSSMFLFVIVRLPLIPIHHMEAHALTARMIERLACMCVRSYVGGRKLQC